MLRQRASFEHPYARGGVWKRSAIACCNGSVHASRRCERQCKPCLVAVSSGAVVSIVKQSRVRGAAGDHYACFSNTRDWRSGGSTGEASGNPALPNGRITNKTHGKGGGAGERITAEVGSTDGSQDGRAGGGGRYHRRARSSCRHVTQRRHASLPWRSTGTERAQGGVVERCGRGCPLKTGSAPRAAAPRPPSSRTGPSRAAWSRQSSCARRT